QNPVHTYFRAESYTVILNIKGPGGSHLIEMKDYIHANANYIDFSASPVHGNFPLLVYFIPDQLDAATNIVWSFGDGYTSTEFKPQHIYSEAGNYTVSLWVSDALDVYVSKKDFIHVAGRTIAGRVLAEDTGDGLPGYLVEVWDSDADVIADIFTQENGCYSITMLPSTDSLYVSVWPPVGTSNYCPQFYQEKILPDTATRLSTLKKDLQDIDFILKKTSDLGFSGKIHINNIGISGIQVDVFSVSGHYVQTIFSDEDGYYTASGLQYAEDYQISVWSDTFSNEFYFALQDNEIPGEVIPTYSVTASRQATLLTPDTPCLSNIDIIPTLNTVFRGSISGCIYESDGTPVKNILVNAWSYDLNDGQFALTNDFGCYTITGLTLTDTHDSYTKGYIVSIPGNQAFSLNYSYQVYDGAFDVANAKYVKTGSTGIDFYLQTGSMISGYVKNQYGLPVPKVQVMAWSKTTGQREETLTNINGAYTLTNLPAANDYILAAFPLNYPVMYYYNKRFETDSDKIDLTHGDINAIHFTIDEGFCIYGTIYINTISQKAKKGLWVNVWSESTQTGGDVSTDKNGAYIISGLDPNACDYIISIRTNEYIPAYYANNQDADIFNDTVYAMKEASFVCSEPINMGTSRNLILKTGITISGKILFNKKPVPGIRVEVWSASTGGHSLCFSDDTNNGSNYKMNGLPPGMYEISITSSTYEDQMKTLYITKSEEFHFILQELTHHISGMITGLPQNHTVYVHAVSTSLNINKTLQITGTGEPVAYTLSNLKQASDYVVECYHPNQYQVYHNKDNFDEADRIDLVGSVSTINFNLNIGSESISGDVTFPQNAVYGETVWIDVQSHSTATRACGSVTFYGTYVVPYTISGLNKTNDLVAAAWSEKYQEQFFDHVSISNAAIFIDTSDDIADKDIHFRLTSGSSISGVVYEHEIPQSDIVIIAYSLGSTVFRSDISDDNGYFYISGLEGAKDVIVKASRLSDQVPYYYNLTQTTRVINLASQLDTTLNKSLENINIYLSVLELISGTVRDQYGKPLSGIWVSAWSEIQQTGFGVYSKENGEYVIEGLPKSKDYKVMVEPDPSLNYIIQEKINVSSLSLDINFFLKQGYTIKGFILDTSDLPIHKVGVELKSVFQNITQLIYTDINGQYVMNGLKGADDYVMTAWPSKNQSYIPFLEKGIVVHQDIMKNIVLSEGYTIKGVILDAFTLSPLPKVIISAYSKLKNYSDQTVTDNIGYYAINTLPFSNDYELVAISDHFAEEKKKNISSGEHVNFNLLPGGAISGDVKDDVGTPLDNVRLEIYSPSKNLIKIANSNHLGHYIVHGLVDIDKNGQKIQDYIVSIHPNAYMSQSQGPKKVGDIVNFRCIKSRFNEISGFIKDLSDNEPPEDIILVIKVFYKQTEGGFVSKIQAKKDGSFTIEGLSPNSTYQIQVLGIRQNKVVLSQWIGPGGQGVSERSQAEAYELLNTGRFIYFKFAINF
ncbi:MAG: carboxypeptidase regulatory-like domain-containing protein, partial [Candidatus Magnetomorum sp.]|nr:carboxypeptidase regulatory-like domain-containing protein [Candidatus Magnetomorum sp.]